MVTFSKTKRVSWRSLLIYAGAALLLLVGLLVLAVKLGWVADPSRVRRTTPSPLVTTTAAPKGGLDTGETVVVVIFVAFLVFAGGAVAFHLWKNRKQGNREPDSEGQEGTPVREPEKKKRRFRLPRRKKKRKGRLGAIPVTEDDTAARQDSSDLAAVLFREGIDKLRGFDDWKQDKKGVKMAIKGLEGHFEGKGLILTLPEAVRNEFVDAISGLKKKAESEERERLDKLVNHVSLIRVRQESAEGAADK